MFSVCPHLGGGGHSADSAREEGGQSADSAGGGVSLAGGSAGGEGVGQPGGGGGQLGGEGVSWGGSAKIGQQNEYSLHGGRYASCVHAGGLSC